MIKPQIFWLMFLAAVVGLIFSLPNLLAYRGAIQAGLIFTAFNAGDENLYASQIRAVMEGKLFSDNLPTTLPWFGPLVLGLIAKLLPSLDWLFVLADFFLPAVIFYLFFRLAWQLTRHFWGSILAAVLPLFLYHLTTKLPPVTPALWQGFRQTLTLTQPYFFGFSRLIPPQFTYIIFLSFLYCLWQVFNSSKKLWTVLTGLTAGLLAYNYFFEWSAALAILAITWGLNLYWRQVKSARLNWALVLSILVSAFYIWQVFAASHPDTQIMFGRINGRFIEPLLTLRYAAVSLLVLWLSAKKTKQFLLSLTLAPVILVNQQLLTGFTIHPGHWPYAVFEPLLPFIGLVILASRFKRFFPDKLKTGLWLVPIFAYAVFNQLAVNRQWQSLHFLKPEEKQLFDWLEVQPPAVILSLDKRLNRYLPVYTHHDLYLPYGSYSTLTVEELWQRINLAASIYQLEAEAYLRLLQSTQFVGQMFDQAYNYHQRSDLNGLSFPETVKAQISSRHPVFSLGVRYIPDNIKVANLKELIELNQLTPNDRVSRYPLDYVLVSPTEKNLAARLDSTIFQPVFVNDLITVYEPQTLN